MSKWITIKTFTLITEVVVLRSHLEAEGIECFVTNELTAQVNPFYSNAIGGIQLQVMEKDLDSAIAILKESGYYTEEETKHSKILLRINSITSKIPYLNKIPLLFRIMMLVVALVGVTVSIVVYSTLPSTDEKLTANNWCLDNVVYNNKAYLPQTIEAFRFYVEGQCEESITFKKNGEITMPGFNSHTIHGRWEMKNNLLQISQADSFDFVYNGTYHIDFSKGGLILQSENTTINCYAQNIY